MNKMAEDEKNFQRWFKQVFLFKFPEKNSLDDLQDLEIYLLRLGGFQENKAKVTSEGRYPIIWDKTWVWRSEEANNILHTCWPAKATHFIKDAG